MRRAASGGGSSSAARDPGPRFSGSGRAGTRARELPRPFLASVPLCPLSPKEEWPNLSLHLKKCREGVRRRAPFSFARRAYGDQGPERADPRKTFQVRKAPAAVHRPVRLAPAGRVSDPRCRWRNEPAWPTGPSIQQAGRQKAKSRRGETPDLIARLNSSGAALLMEWD